LGGKTPVGGGKRLTSVFFVDRKVALVSMPTRRAVMHPLFYYSAFLLLFFFYCVTLANAVYAQKAPRGDVAPIQFADVTAASGITFEHAVSSEKKYLYESMSGGVLLFDYDQDGWLDIYFTNAQSVAMTLAGPHGLVHQILAVTGLLTWFDVDDTVEEAGSRAGTQSSPVLPAIAPAGRPRRSVLLRPTHGHVPVAILPTICFDRCTAS